MVQGEAEKFQDSRLLFASAKCVWICSRLQLMHCGASCANGTSTLLLSLTVWVKCFRFGHGWEFQQHIERNRNSLSSFWNNYYRRLTIETSVIIKGTACATKPVKLN